MNENRTIRVAIQQPVLPDYRVQLFKQLSQRPGLDVKVYYGDKSNSPANAKNIPFNTRLVHLCEARIGKRSILWHAPQVTCATRKQCDVLVLSWDLHYASLIPGLLFAKASGVRTILWGHGYSKNETGLRQRLRDRVGKLADAVLLYDRATAERLIARGFNPNNVFVAPNAIDQSPIQAARQYWLDRPHELEAFKRAQGLEPGPVILFVSRLDPHNRLDLLVQALPRLTERYPDIQAVIIGKGEEEKQRLVAIATELNVSKHLRFLGAIYDEQDLAPWFICAKVFCYPANIGLSILHAFGYGLPVVTSDRMTAQNPEIVSLRHQDNGLTYRDGSEEELAFAIDDILQNQSVHDRMSKEAHRTSTQLFSLRQMVDGMQAAIKAII